MYIVTFSIWRTGVLERKKLLFARISMTKIYTRIFSISFANYFKLSLVKNYGVGYLIIFYVQAGSQLQIQIGQVNYIIMFFPFF